MKIIVLYVHRALLWKDWVGEAELGMKCKQSSDMEELYERIFWHNV